MITSYTYHQNDVLILSTVQENIQLISRCEERCSLGKLFYYNAGEFKIGLIFFSIVVTLQLSQHGTSDWLTNYYGLNGLTTLT